MLTQEQLDRLNCAIRQDYSTDGPLLKLANAAKRENLAFQDIIEYLVVQAVENACSMDINHGVPNQS